VEDNRADQILVREALHSAGHATDKSVKDHPAGSPRVLHVVRDGEEALAFLRRTGSFADVPRPDLVLLDLNLPKRNGREVLIEMRSDASLREIPVVILTSSASDEEIYRCYAAGANCYLTKSVDLEEHLALLRSAAAFWLHDASPSPEDERDRQG
jgi:two-component system, chemotaxis family, response regulator Rcp1